MAKKKGGFFKRLGRKTAKLSTKINRVAVPIISAGAGAIGGAPAAAAVTAIGAQASYYFRATQARNEGQMGPDARARGRGERKRVAIYGAVGGGAGMLGSGVYTLASGGTLAQALGTTAFGQGGKALLFGSEGTIFANNGLNGSNFVTAANLASQKASPVPGLVTQSQLSSVLAGGATPTEAAAAVGGGSGGTLAKVLGVGTTLLGQTKLPGTTGGAPPTQPNDAAYREGLLEGLLSGMGGGGGGGGDSGGGGLGGFMNAPTGESTLSTPVLIALGLGALYFIS